MKNNSLFIGFILSLIIIFISCSGNKNKNIHSLEMAPTTLKSDRLENNHCVTLVKGYVPDTITAIKISEAIWLPIYGNEIYKYLPFKAILLNDSIWEVSGTIHTPKGGSPFALIRKKDGMIVDVYHEE